VAADIYTQLPPDSTANKNKIRVLSLTPPDFISGGDGVTTVVQEIVSLATATGELVTGGPLGDPSVEVKVQEEVVEQLHAIKSGIAYLILLMAEATRIEGHTGALIWADRQVGSNHIGSQ
jgi:hypothetical protein